MDFEALVAPISSYINYFVQFWFQCSNCLSEYKGLNEVSPSAVILALVSILLYLLIRYTNLNIVPADPFPRSGEGPKIDINTAIFLFTTSLATVVFFEIGLWISDGRSSRSFGSIFDSVNAGLLSSAALYPVAAVSARVQYVCQKMSKVAPPTSRVATALNLVVAVPTIYLSVIAMKPFAVLHGVTPLQLLLPALAGFLAFLVPVIFGGVFLYEWNKYVVGALRTKRQ